MHQPYFTCLYLPWSRYLGCMYYFKSTTEILPTFTVERLIKGRNFRLLWSTTLVLPLHFRAHQGECFLRENGLHVHNTHLFSLELVSKELNHFGVIAGFFQQIGGHSSRFVQSCSFWRLFTIKMIKSVKVFPFSLWKIITIFF